MQNSGSSPLGQTHTTFYSPLRLGHHWKSRPASEVDAPALQALPSELILGPFPWFRSEDEMLPFDADCFDER